MITLPVVRVTIPLQGQYLLNAAGIQAAVAALNAREGYAMAGAMVLNNNAPNTFIEAHLIAAPKLADDADFDGTLHDVLEAVSNYLPADHPLGDVKAEQIDTSVVR